jgi:hypothetical protein
VWTEALYTFEALKDPNAGRVWQWLADLEPEPELEAQSELGPRPE